MENAKIQKFKCDILSDFQTMCTMQNVFYNEYSLHRERLKNMLENVKCEIISMSRNGQVDAYVLSESSMFISQRRFILKTCGTTTPLECIRDLLAMAKLFAGFDGIEVE